MLRPFKNNLTWLDLGAFSGYVAALSIAVAHHEPWADEAQSWLVVRELPFWRMMFSEVRYENSPGAWYVVLWVSQHIFHAPYSAINWIGAALAAAGAGVLIFCAPFPRPLRYLMCSSYYIAYQYAVIARPYVMLLLFGCLAAIFYRRRAPIRFAIAIALLCGTSTHGAILAAAISLGAAWHLIVKRDWPVGQLRARYLGAMAIVVVAGIMVVVIMLPRADRGSEHRFAAIQSETLTGLLSETIVEPWPIGACLLLLLTAFAVRNGEPIVFIAGVGGLFAFEWLVFSAPQHWGSIVVALIVCLWIAWPREEHWNLELTAAAFVLAGIFAIQTVGAVSAWRQDYAGPYSGSKDAADYLRAAGADHAHVFGVFYSMVAIQAYFDHNIFENWPTAYHHFSKSEDAAVCSWDGTGSYDYIVVPLVHLHDDPHTSDLQNHGYFPVHVSPGYNFFKNGVSQTETFVIYRRGF